MLSSPTSPSDIYTPLERLDSHVCSRHHITWPGIAPVAPSFLPLSSGCSFYPPRGPRLSDPLRPSMQPRSWNVTYSSSYSDGCSRPCLPAAHPALSRAIASISPSPGAGGGHSDRQQRREIYCLQFPAHEPTIRRSLSHDSSGL